MTKSDVENEVKEDISTRKKRTARTQSSRIWSSGNTNYEQYTGVKFKCKVCLASVPQHLLSHMERWWERQMILVALVMTGHRTKEEAKKEYQASIRNYRKGFKIHLGSGYFYVCRDHLAHAGKCWMDILKIKSPDDVMKAKKPAVKMSMDIMKYFNDREFNFKSEKAFLEHCDQFISYDWQRICEIYPHLSEVLEEMEEMEDVPASLQEINVQEYENDENNVFLSPTQEISEYDDTMELFEPVMDMAKEEPESKQEITLPEPPLNLIKKGKVCKICGERVVKGHDISSDWTRRIVIYMAYQKGYIGKERVFTLFYQTNRIFICPEHSREAVEEIYELFGTRDPTNFIKMYSSYKQNVERTFKDIRFCFGLDPAEKIEKFIKGARSFASIHRIDVDKPPAPSTSPILRPPTPKLLPRISGNIEIPKRLSDILALEIPKSPPTAVDTPVPTHPAPPLWMSTREPPSAPNRETSKRSERRTRPYPNTSRYASAVEFCSPSREGFNRAVRRLSSIRRGVCIPSSSQESSYSDPRICILNDGPPEDMCPRPKTVKSRNQCQICKARNVEEVVTLSIFTEIVCVFVVLMNSQQWTESRVMEMYNERVKQKSGVKLAIGVQHYRGYGNELLKYLKIDSVEHSNNVDQSQLENIRKFAEKVDPEIPIPDDFLNRCLNFVKKCSKRA